MSFRAPKRERCITCQKTVYEQEMVKVDDKVYHRGCFRCKECQCVIKPGNYAALEGEYYCKAHFKQLFKLKGNYSEGFGKKKHTDLWLGDEGGRRKDSGESSPATPSSPLATRQSNSATPEQPGTPESGSPVIQPRRDGGSGLGGSSPLVRVAASNAAGGAPDVKAMTAAFNRDSGGSNAAGAEPKKEATPATPAAAPAATPAATPAAAPAATSAPAAEATHQHKEDGECCAHEAEAEHTNGNEEGKEKAEDGKAGQLANIPRESLRKLKDQGTFVPISERFKEVK